MIVSFGLGLTNAVESFAGVLSPEQIIANEVAAQINAEVGLPVDVVAEREYDANTKLEDLEKEKITVVARDLKMPGRPFRGAIDLDIVIDVALQKRMAKVIDRDEKDQLSALVNAIRQKMDEDGFAPQIEDESFHLETYASEPLWNPIHLRDWQQYTNVTSYTFSGVYWR